MFLKSTVFRAFTLIGLYLALGVCPVFGANLRVLPEHIPASVGKMTPLSRLPSTNEIRLTIGLTLRNQAALDQFLAEIYDPASPNFRKFLTPEELVTRFSPTEAEYAAVKHFAQTNGLTIRGTHGNRLLLDVTGSTVNLERAFHIKLNRFKHPTEARDFFAPDTDPTVDAALPITDVQGLSDFYRPKPKFRKSDLGLIAKGGSAPNNSGAYFGDDFRHAYAPGTTLTGAGQQVGLVQFDGFYSSDIVAYATAAGGGRTNIVIQTVLLDGFSGTPTTGSNSGEPEVALDIEMAMAMAPGLSRIMVFEAPNNTGYFNDILNSMLASNQVKNLSCSWGGGGANVTSENIFKLMAAQGQSFFNASGDSCAFTGSVPFPSESTNITQVGATTLTSGSSATYVSERVWNWGETIGSSYDGVGSSGGISTTYSIPGWQQGISLTAAHGSTTTRNIPDVALTGDNVYVAYNNGSAAAFGGTSCAAPLWAGFTALINEQAALAAQPSVGFLNPAIYAIGKSVNYNNCFHDTTSGDNFWSSSPTNFPAVTGYDLCTGWGSPTGTNLINALAPLVFAPAVIGGNWTLVSESATPTNGAVDPGETVTVSFKLQNQGNLPTTNLVATLLADAGVLAPSGPQNYGALASFGGSTNRNFTFTTAGTCGANITATLQLQDGTGNLGTVSFTLPLGKLQGLAQNFDGVTAPALPSGWTSSAVSGSANNWVTTTGVADTAPASAFNSESSTAAQNALVSPVIPIISANARLSFQHTFGFEIGSGSRRYDGGVLEIKIGSGAFTDILTAGGSFVTNGYNGAISSGAGFDNPLGGRSAWVNTSSGWKLVTVNLPATAAGQNIQLRWNCATDSGNAGSSVVGWNVDSIAITDAPPSCLSVFTDLAASQSLSANSSQSGQNLVYTLTVTNLGPQSAANVVLTDTVPASVAFVSVLPGGTYASGKIICPVETLPVGAVTNFTVTLAPVGDGVFTNIIQVATITPEISSGNNTASLISTQAAQASASIMVGPANQAIQCSSNVSFAVQVGGTSPLSIQWSLDGTPISGATNTSLTLTNLHLPNHSVAVTVTNLYGGATNIATVTVSDTLAPVVTLFGASVVTNELGFPFTDPGATAYDACVGALPVTTNGAVNINVVGTNTLTYSANDGNGNTGSVPRTVIVRDTTPPMISWSFTNLVLAADSNCTALLPDLTGTNYLLASDLSGAVTVFQNPTNNTVLSLGTNVIVFTVRDASSNAAFSTNLVIVRDQTPPVILSQPQSRTNLVGSTVTFSFNVTACTALMFQWYSNSIPLASTGDNSLVLSNLTTAAAGDYFVVATADGGSSTSVVAALTVKLIPPGINNGASALDGSFNLNLTGSPGHTYVLEATTNLMSAGNWLPIATNTLGPYGTWHFSDASATNFPLQFYRLMLVQ